MVVKKLFINSIFMKFEMDLLTLKIIYQSITCLKYYILFLKRTKTINICENEKMQKSMRLKLFFELKAKLIIGEHFFLFSVFGHK